MKIRLTPFRSQLIPLILINRVALGSNLDWVEIDRAIESSAHDVLPDITSIFIS